MTSTTQEARPAADDERDWRTDVLYDTPQLRPLRRWASERFASLLVKTCIVWTWALSIFVLAQTARDVAMLLTLVAAMAFSRGSIAVAERISRRRRAEACRRSPGEPWRNDRDWNARGETRSWLVRVAETCVRPDALVRIPFNMFVIAGVILFVLNFRYVAMLLLGIAAAWACVFAWRIHGAGDSRLTYSKFPFHPGERVTLYFGMSSGGAQFRDAEFRLYHVTEYVGGPFRRIGGVRIDASMRERRPPGTLPGPDLDVEVSFDVPADAPSTRLTDDLPAYWVLEVRGATTAGRYVERFLVPIYERPAESPAREASAT